MKWTFLSADKPLTKTYIFSPDGTYDSTPYPLSAEFTSYEVRGSTLEDFYAALVAHSECGHCLLKGNLQRPIQRESRKGLTLAEATLLCIFDLDGLFLEAGYTIEGVLECLGVPLNTSYILQYSASQGIKSGVNAHVFLLLDRPTAVEHLKLWLKWKNLTVKLLADQLRLTKSNMALHWPLDITVCQNDKLIYIAPPNIVGRNDPVERRIRLVNRGNGRLHVGDIPGNVEQDAKEKVRQLRSTAGLPDHRLEVKYYKQDRAELLANPDQSAVTGIKRNGVFTYLNLNGGDSWGYYHTTAQPEILFNFKGEPNYRLRELSPSYYDEARAYARTIKRDAHRPNEEGLDRNRKWIINHVAEGRYYKIVYDVERGVTLYPAPTLKHVEDWCISNHIPVPENIEDWNVEFNPTTTTTIDVQNKVINTYKPTVFKVRSQQLIEETGKDQRGLDTYQVSGIFNERVQLSTGATVPRGYWLLIHHVCGGDVVATERFLNWLAYIWQTGKKPQTSWVFHGTYGTGKGRLMRILRMLFDEHFVVTSPEMISEHFNSSIEKAQILWIDEVTTDSWDNSKITPKLRQWITDDYLTLRQMRRDGRQVRNYMGIIIAGNEHNIIEIRFKDRRYNVAPRQETPIKGLIWAEGSFLHDEGWLYQEDNLLDFAVALQRFPVDEPMVKEPLLNDAKLQVMQVTQSLPEDIVQAFLAGDVNFFLEHVQPANALPSVEATEYKNFVARIMRGGRVAVPSREIMAVFNYLAGWKQPVGKFTKAASKYGLHLKGRTARVGDEVFAGTYYDFDVTEAHKLRWSQLNNVGLRLVKED